MCHKVYVNERWVLPELSLAGQRNITHCYCDQCAARLEQQIEEYFHQQQSENPDLVAGASYRAPGPASPEGSD